MASQEEIVTYVKKAFEEVKDQMKENWVDGIDAINHSIKMFFLEWFNVENINKAITNNIPPDYFGASVYAGQDPFNCVPIVKGKPTGETEEAPENVKKLWLLSTEHKSWYDTYDGFIACAFTEDDAKKMSPGDNGETWAECRGWAKSLDAITVKYIGLADPSIDLGIVLASFNAA